MNIVINIGFLLFSAMNAVMMIAIGALRIDECPAISELPIILITSGCILAFGALVNIADALIEGYVYRSSIHRRSKLIKIVNAIVIVLLAICIIVASVFVYGRPQPAEDPTESSDKYCHATVWNFTYWTLNLMLVVIGLSLVLSLIGIVTNTTEHVKEDE